MIKNGNWVIPPFPSGWKDAIGHKIFKVMMDWRKSAIFNHASAKSLGDNFSLYSVAGREFGPCEGAVVIIWKALYGLKSSSRAFRLFFAEFLRSCGFKPTRYDRDVWMRVRDSNDGYDYICTHVDDFKIVAKTPKHWMDLIEAKFVLKSVGQTSY